MARPTAHTLVLLVCGAAVVGLCCAKGAHTASRPQAPELDAGEDIHIEMEAASVDADWPDGGAARHRPPEDKRVQAAFGKVLRGIENPMRACGRARSHPAQGKTKILVSLDPNGVVTSVARELSPGMEAMAECMEEAVRELSFPRSDRPHRVRLESRFETQR